MKSTVAVSPAALGPAGRLCALRLATAYEKIGEALVRWSVLCAGRDKGRGIEHRLRPLSPSSTAVKESMPNTTSSVRKPLEYEPVIGLEVHAELQTRLRCFAPARWSDSVQPRLTAVCPVCAGMPGVLPVVNQQAVE